MPRSPINTIQTSGESTFSVGYVKQFIPPLRRVAAFSPSHEVAGRDGTGHAGDLDQEIVVIEKAVVHRVDRQEGAAKKVYGAATVLTPSLSTVARRMALFATSRVVPPIGVGWRRVAYSR
jgi:hypothetical protein